MSLRNFQKSIRRGFSSQGEKPKLAFPKKFFENTYYIENYQKCVEKTGIDHFSCKLNGKEVMIFGLPLCEYFTNEEYFQQYYKDLSEISLQHDQSSLALVQIDPTIHLYQKKSFYGQIESKITYKNVIQMESQMDEMVVPQNLEDLIFDPIILEASKASQEQLSQLIEIIKTKDAQKIAQYKGYYQALQGGDIDQLESKEGQEKTKEISTQIDEEVLFFEREKQKQDLKQVLMMNQMKNRANLLCGIPEFYNRITISRGMSLQQLQEMYKKILQFMKENSIENIASLEKNILAEYFQMQQDYYFFFLLQNSTIQTSHEKISIYVKNIHFDPLKTLIEFYGDHGYLKEQTIPQFLKLEKPQESEEILIEKQALIDCIFGTELWKLPIIKNPFLYLNSNFLKLDSETQEKYQKVFYTSRRKYQILQEKYLKSNKKN